MTPTPAGSPAPRDRERADLLANAPWRIAVVAFCILSLELSLIRLIPAEVRIISYFTNLIFMASFFGLGLGMIALRLGRLPLLMPLGLALVAAFVMWTRGLVIYAESTSVHYWLQYEQPEGTALSLPLLPTALAAFVVTALPFIALGARLATEMDRFPRLVAYGWDIAGSVAGVAVFVASSALGQPPWIWPIIVAVIWAALFSTGALPRALTAIVGIGFALFSISVHEYRWSPYYYVQYQREALGLRVWVNSSFHQFAADLSPTSQTAPKEFQRSIVQKFALPYEVYRAHHDRRVPRKVLILGAGTGNDVNVALALGAAEIVAVEIDPEILRLGKEFNATSPYADPRVRTVLDDARHYLRTTTERFDLIVFGTLDSQTLLSGASNIRLENYVYTQQSFRDARRLLNQGGMVATYYSVFKPWLIGRLVQTICPPFDGQCRVYQTPDERLFNTVIIGAESAPGFEWSIDLADPAFASEPSTDDWPFLYLESRELSGIYVGLMLCIGVLISLVFVLVRRTHPATSSRASFLFLGVGFTLMEAAAIVRLALLFGSTWTVNAAVFLSVLIMIFVANVCVQRGIAPRLGTAWIGIMLGALVNYLVDVSTLLELPAGVQGIAAGALIGVPVFFASVCFSRLFAREASTGHALGLNLVGAMAGGLVEYLSMLIGMRAIWAIVAIVYFSAWLASRTLRSGAVDASARESSASIAGVREGAAHGAAISTRQAD